MYAQAAAASGGDPYLDFIGSVTYRDNAGVEHPAIFCSIDFDPNRVYIARPAVNHAPPLFPAPLPPNVQLHYRGEVIAPSSVAPDQIRFSLPPDPVRFLTGFVYLKTLGPSLTRTAQQLARTCGRVIPSIPNAVLVDRSPAAQITVIYPPLIDAFSASQPDAEACAGVDLRWQTHLQQQEASWPIPQGASIRVDIVDDQGISIVNAGPPSGSVQVMEPDTRTYTLIATSLIGQQSCGVATQTLTVRRTRYVYQVWDPADMQQLISVPNPDGAPIAAGDDVRFNVSVSCNVPADLPLTFTFVPARQPLNGVILRGQHSTANPITFSTDLHDCGTVSVTVAADGHTARQPPDKWPPPDYPASDPEPGHYDVYSPPELTWSLVPNPIAGERISVDITATCMPADDSRIEWLLTDPVGTPRPIMSPDSVAKVTTGQYHLSITAGVLTAGEWKLHAQIPSRKNIPSNQLPLVVAAAPTFTIVLADTMPANSSVEWDETATFNVTVNGQNIPAGGIDVDLEGVDLQAGPTPEFTSVQNGVSRRVSLTRAAPAQTAVLSVPAVFGITQPGSRPFKVRGLATLAIGPLTVESANRTITIRRRHGPFITVPLPLRSAVPAGNPPTVKVDANCEPGTPHCAASGVKAVISGVPNSYTMHFETSNGNSQEDASTGLFAFSHGCRIGLEIPPLPMGAQLETKFFNLAFPETVFPSSRNVIRIGGLIDDVPYRWQGYLFSQDETLVIIWGSSGVAMPPQGSSPPAQQVILYDCLKQQQMNSQTFTGFNMTAILNPPDPPRRPQSEVVFTYTDAVGQNPQNLTWLIPD
jgi:hypothetical protein